MFKLHLEHHGLYRFERELEMRIQNILHLQTSNTAYIKNKTILMSVVFVKLIHQILFLVLQLLENIIMREFPLLASFGEVFFNEVVSFILKKRERSAVL